jgi:hypothetical protein
MGWQEGVLTRREALDWWEVGGVGNLAADWDIGLGLVRFGVQQETACFELGVVGKVADEGPVASE